MDHENTPLTVSFEVAFVFCKTFVFVGIRSTAPCGCEHTLKADDACSISN
jgi:hypothetical protein